VFKIFGFGSCKRKSQYEFNNQRNPEQKIVPVEITPYCRGNRSRKVNKNNGDEENAEDEKNLVENIDVSLEHPAHYLMLSYFTVEYKEPCK